MASNYPPGTTGADIDRYFGGPEPIVLDRCSRCGAWLPVTPARGTREEEKVEQCDGIPDTEYGITACSGAEGWTGHHKPHTFTAHWALLELHTCRRCGHESEVVRDAI